MFAQSGIRGWGWSRRPGGWGRRLPFPQRDGHAAGEPAPAQGQLWRGPGLTGYAFGVLVPLALTIGLREFQVDGRDYPFAYLGVVAVLGLTMGLGAALTSAAAGFLLSDYFAITPYYSLTLVDPQDAVNFVALVAAAVLVSRRRRQQRRAEALARALGVANHDLERLNCEQAESAEARLQLALAEQRIENLARNELIRRELLANVSHDLRTPISSILSAATSALEDEELSPTTRRSLNAGVSQAWRLNRLVQDMLDMTRLEANAIEIEPEAMDLREAVGAAIERLDAPGEAVRVTLAIDEEIIVMADWQRLGQVLDNLLSNADRFAPDSSLICVSGTRDSASNVALIRVTDHGPGIPDEIRDRIFDRFVRSSDPRGGTGLGLCIVRGLVEAQGGRVWLEQDPDTSGTTFAFTVPLGETDAA